MRIVVLCMAVVLLHAQQNPQEILAGVRSRVMNTINRLPRYMCTQTVDRSVYRLNRATHHPSSCEDLMQHRSGRQQVWEDRLRFDVSVGGAREMYSWVGERRFSDQKITDLVRTGAISNGNFATFVTAIFTGDSAAFSYEGEKNERGRRMASFTFEVPRALSGYVFSSGNVHVITAYEGSFLVDPETFDLGRLVVRTKGLPPEVNSCEAATTLDYHRVRLHDSEFLLPASSNLKILDADGYESENRTTFSNCHEFLGESTISFDDTYETAGSTKDGAANLAIAIPDGLAITVTVTQSIDTTKAAVGDTVPAKLAAALKDQASRVLVPAGAPATFRIVDIRRVYLPSPSVLISLRLESLTIGGAARPVNATIKSAMDMLAPGGAGRSGMLLRREEIGNAYAPADPTAAAIAFRDIRHDLVIPSGLRLNGVTGAVAKSNSAVTTTTGPTPRRDPKEMLATVRARFAETIQHLTNYQCAETIDRTQSRRSGVSRSRASCDDLLAAKGSLAKVTSDRLRLDVVAGEKYAWAGDTRFDLDLSNFASGSSHATGSFLSLLKMVFSVDMPDFSYDGEAAIDGRKLAQFGFRVPVEQSHYWFESQGARVLSAYTGSLFVDPLTLDPVRLMVRTAQLPVETGACEATDTLTYTPAPPIDGNFLLPSVARSLILADNGVETESVTAFSQCRDIAIPSKRSTKAIPESAAALPPDLPFTISLDRDIYTEAAAAGDLFTARLTTPIMDASGKILVRPGAPITGRILRVRRYYGTPPALKIELKLETIKLDGKPSLLSAAPFGSPVLLAEMAGGSRLTDIHLGPLEATQPGVGAIYFQDVLPNFVVKKNLSLKWATVR